MSVAQEKVAFVFTNANVLKDGSPTGWYLSEAAHPYFRFVEVCACRG
jgi:hypothetical protein